MKRMKITLKNKELQPAIEFLMGIPLKRAESRHRTKLVNLLRESLEELSKAETALMNEAGLLNSDGELLPDDERDVETVKQFNADQAVLYDEEVIIQGGTYAKNIEQIPDILNNYDEEMSGGTAEIYDRLLDEFEKNTEVKVAE